MPDLLLPFVALLLLALAAGGAWLLWRRRARSATLVDDTGPLQTCPRCGAQALRVERDTVIESYGVNDSMRSTTYHRERCRTCRYKRNYQTRHGSMV